MAAVTQQPVSAQVVGNAFVEQYYHILHHSPALVHRFYKDISKLGRPEEDGSMSITTSMQAINDKIVSMNYGDFRAEIKSVDAQESFNGGVHVLVTGSLTGKDDKVSNFAQTFFLAPQDMGYFVLNDMFRYVNSISRKIKKKKKKRICVNSISLNPPLVSDDAAKPVPAPVQEKHVSEQNPPSAPDVHASSLDSVDNRYNQEGEADGYSIYIMGLPMTASEALLEDVFKKFGTIKKDGIQVKRNRQQQFCFGFVEFEEACSVQKAIEALDVLPDMPASSIEQRSGYYKSTSREDSQYLLEPNSCVGDRTSDSTSNSSDVGFQDNVWFAGNPFRNDFKASESSGNHHSTETGNLQSELLKSLFNMPTPKAAEKETNTLNWRNIVKKMASLGQRLENSGSEQAKGNEYQMLRGAAHQYCDSMKSYNQNGRLQKKMAREADEKASRDTFTEKNKSVENVITFDLHGQNIKQAMKLLKLHLLFGAYLQSVKSFRVITGRGSHSVGKPKLKNSVINFLQNEGISWSEENPGALLVRLDGQTDFNFQGSGSESD